MDVSQDREQRGKEPPVQLGQSQTFISQRTPTDPHNMIMEDNWKYLGDILSSDGKNDANIKARTYRGLGAITNIFSYNSTSLFNHQTIHRRGHPRLVILSGSKTIFLS